MQLDMQKHTHLVLHSTHVEIIHSNNVINIQIILQSKRILVPLHGLFQTSHGMVQLGDIARL